MQCAGVEKDKIFSYVLSFKHLKFASFSFLTTHDMTHMCIFRPPTKSLTLLFFTFIIFCPPLLLLCVCLFYRKKLISCEVEVVESVPKCKQRLAIEAMPTGGKQFRCSEHLWKLVTIVYESLNSEGS